MSIDWDALVLAPLMGIFGEGGPDDDEMLPLYTPRGLPGFRLHDAVFDAAYKAVDIVDDVPTTSIKPVLGVRLSLFPRPPAQNDRVYIPSAGKTYIVRDPRDDGHGHMLLILMEAK